MLFKELNLIPPILDALRAEGYSQPTPIQEQAIPFILQGKDLLGCAQTGTGKTAAFAIPILQLLHAKKSTDRNLKRPIKALIVTPTRELAIQISESFNAYGINTGLKNTVVFGGVSQKAQTDALKAGVDILIATPGRLLDLIQQKFVNLQSLDIFVLDEADRMLDMGFIHDVKKLLAIIPARRQSLFFSATMAPTIVKLAETILNKPASVSVTPVSSTAETIQQLVYFVDQKNKNSLLSHVLEDKAIGTALVFTRTKHGANKVTKYLLSKNIMAEAIHGNKSQSARQTALQNFKNRTTRILVATDIASRGIDIDDLTHVINFEIPNIPETYVHRIGRSGRAGAKGTSFSFCDAEEKEFLRDIEKLIGKKIPVFEDHPFPMTNDRPELKAQTQHSLRPKQSKPSSSARNKSKGNSGNSSRPASAGGQGNAARPASSNSENSSRPSSGGSGNSSRPPSRNSGNSARPSSNAPKKKWPGAGNDSNDNRNY
ncbi:MAG: DEAD/DEAH box helicase [Cytophagaceae bacterium]|nr:DEAD/DEAH box helicase [Cytophagaceae bacterium]